MVTRASRLLSESSMSDSHRHGRDIEQAPSNSAHSDFSDGRTPLDRTIDRIGMGSYQWTLVSLCGFGWLADNMWMQAIAIILPRVQQHYSVSDSHIGVLSSSMFAGMMCGAIGWGTCSDILGRITAFNATLFFTAVFGIIASFTTSFQGLCISLFLLGSAVGGSMPTDGTLLLEHMPKGKQHLVTALSVFFSVGAVVAAVVALLVVPQYSCPPDPPCNVDTQNQGWKYLLVTLGIITLSMFLARIVFFRLHESPRYLVHAGRPQEAVKALQMISRFNGSDLSIELCDVVDQLHPRLDASTQTRSTTTAMDDPGKPADTRCSAPIPIANTRIKITESSPLSTPPKEGTLDISESNTLADYRATSEVVPSFHPSPRCGNLEEDQNDEEEEDREDVPLNPEERRREETNQPTSSTRRAGRTSFASTLSVPNRKRTRLRTLFPRWLTDPVDAWRDRILMVLAPRWIRTTLLVWSTWFGMALAFTMFNIYLPKLLEYGSSQTSLVAQSKSLQDALWDVVFFSIGGCPGAILGAYLIRSRLGRRWSLAGSTLLTAALCMAFTAVQSQWAVRFTTVGINLSVTIMWAVLYGWTPQIFGTEVRGTACGTASALSRIGGMIAPLLGGMLLVKDRSLPVYASTITFVIAGLCVLLLKEDNSPRDRRGHIIVH